MTRRRILVLAGPHGAGKTGHADALAASLKSLGHDVEAWHHPPPPGPPRTALARALWYAWTREHLAMARPCSILVADRWTESTRAAARATILPEQEAMVTLADAEDCVYAPEAMILLDASHAVIEARLRARHGRGQTREELAEARYLRSTFADDARVDTDAPREMVAAEILRLACALLNLKGGGA